MNIRKLVVNGNMDDADGNALRVTSAPSGTVGAHTPSLRHVEAGVVESRERWATLVVPISMLAEMRALKLESGKTRLRVTVEAYETQDTTADHVSELLALARDVAETPNLGERPGIRRRAQELIARIERGT